MGPKRSIFKRFLTENAAPGHLPLQGEGQEIFFQSLVPLKIYDNPMVFQHRIIISIIIFLNTYNLVPKILYQDAYKPKFLVSHDRW